jgi:hypothetical protein
MRLAAYLALFACGCRPIWRYLHAASGQLWRYLHAAGGQFCRRLAAKSGIFCMWLAVTPELFAGEAADNFYTVPLAASSMQIHMSMSPTECKPANVFQECWRKQGT